MHCILFNLWPGLWLDWLLKLKDPNGSQTFSMNFNTDNTPTAQQESHGKSKYKTLHPDDKNTVESIF